jgi:hypothetical protein
VRAIPEFRAVLDEWNLGVECMTAIALATDHLTLIRNYNKKDRPFKAMEIATKGNRKAYVWNQEIIQKALIEYDKLQFSAVIEEKRLLDDMRLTKLNEIRDEVDEKMKVVLFKQLKTIKDLIDDFNKEHKEDDIFADGIVKNGYKLTRLEIKALDRTSFYYKDEE